MTAASRWIERHRTILWIALGVALALLLRAPWHDAALGRDEAGDAMVARAWHGSGQFAYGSYFLDRPPLLLALYRLAGDTPTGIRTLGAAAAALLVVIVTLLAVRVAGRRSAPWAAALAAVLASSYAIRSVFTPAELLAALPSCASVLLLVTALGREKRRFGLLAAAGALAATALLVKQSFADALAAGVVVLVAGKLTGVSWRETARRSAAYGSGVAVLAGALVAWVVVMHTSASSVWYAMFGFRLDAMSSLASNGPGLSQLRSPFLSSGLAVALLFAIVGIARLNARPLVRLALATWMTAAAVGVLLSGSYLPHYLIALVPVAAVGAAAVFQRHRLVGALVVCAVAVPTAVDAAGVARHDSADSLQQSAVTIGRYIHARALPGQTAYVLYAKVNTLFYAGLPDPFPYNWSLMMRAVPHAQARLRGLLDSPRRPTWVVRNNGTRAFGLDRSGATRRLLARHYRPVADVCGGQVLLARGARARQAPATGATPPEAGGQAGCSAGAGRSLRARRRRPRTPARAAKDRRA